ncbi:MAG TPA: hypothetical protein VHX61_05630 [Rhizomicrobium sp.]|nr:hypothetical protein [Rhizomicrobium sp.]
MHFAIVATDRTGSSHLTNFLDSQDGVLCNGEVFHSRAVYVNWPKRERSTERLSALIELRDRDPAAFTDHVFSRNFGCSHVGLKILKGQNDRALDGIIDNSSILKVVLYRRNVLANYSSKKLASLSKEWHLTRDSVRDDVPGASCKVIFNAARFVAFHDEYTGFYRRILTRIGSGQQPFQFVAYEDINEPRLLTGLFLSLGINWGTGRTPSRYIKQNPADILSRFANRSDVEQFLRERNLMHWSYECETSLEPMATEEARQDEGVHEPPQRPNVNRARVEI